MDIRINNHLEENNIIRIKDKNILFVSPVIFYLYKLEIYKGDYSKIFEEYGVNDNTIKSCCRYVKIYINKFLEK